MYEHGYVTEISKIIKVYSSACTKVPKIFLHHILRKHSIENLGVVAVDYAIKYNDVTTDAQEIIGNDVVTLQPTIFGIPLR